MSTVKVDASAAADMRTIARAAQRLEEMGYDGLKVAELNHDPFMPLAIAAEHTETIDCSGLTQLSSTLCGYKLPRDAAQQWALLKPQSIEFSELGHGDLVFFHKSDPDKVTHVGFAWKPDGSPIKVLHASGEVRLDPLDPDGIMRDGRITHQWTGAARWPVSAG